MEEKRDVEEEQETRGGGEGQGGRGHGKNERIGKKTGKVRKEE